MPRFFFNIRNGEALVKDPEGIDLPGLQEAKGAAMVSGREILAENVRINVAHPLRKIIIATRAARSWQLYPPRTFFRSR